MLTYSLPRPPSQNGLFKNLPRRGRVKTRSYLRWIDQADRYYVLQQLGRCPPIKGKYQISIKVPRSRADTDNLAKAVSDWSVSRGLIPDDSNATKVTIEVDPTLTDCLVEVRAA